MKDCRRVNKTDGKMNGGTMIPRFLFHGEVAYTPSISPSLFLLFADYRHRYRMTRLRGERGARTRITENENVPKIDENKHRARE